MVLERMPLETQKELFKRVEDYMDVSNLKEEDMEKYEATERAVENYNLGIYGAWIKGYRNGRKLSEQRDSPEGEIAVKLEIACNLFLMGMSRDQIMQATGLTEEQMAKL